MLKRILACVATLFCAGLLFAELPLVPMPKSVTWQDGVSQTTNITYQVDRSMANEAYAISITTNAVTIRSANEAGRIYAMSTLNQLRNADGSLPCVLINDMPTFAWRGLHLDVSRHFFDKDAVKRILDRMVELKLNVFHWHLTDDHGWRIPMVKYPLMNTVGATRKLPEFSEWFYDEQESGTYGPFSYSVADIEEIRAYAKARAIRIVPEIDLPGHCRSIVMAYPELYCEHEGELTPERLGEYPALCLGNDKTIAFLEYALERVCELFPESDIIHIGGDECPRTNWQKCPRCQARIKKEGLKSEDALQDWATKHFAKFLAERGRQAIGWGEIILNGEGDTGGAYVMDGGENKGAILAAKAGIKTVLCPNIECYYDYSPDLGEYDSYKYPLFSLRTKLPLLRVYSFNPYYGIPKECRDAVLGGQCCNWTEYTPTLKELEWKIFPRAFAMAEALWCGDKKPGYGSFLKRAEALRRCYVAKGINCGPITDRQLFKGTDPRAVQLREEATPPLRVLFVGAHPDDTDLRCPAASIRLVKSGARVKWLSMTNGDRGHQYNDSKTLARRRRTEATLAAKITGIEEYMISDTSDCHLVPSLEERAKLTKVIREFKPHIIVTHRSCDYHPDHRAAGQLVTDATYLSCVPLWASEYPCEDGLVMPAVFFYTDRFTSPTPSRCDLLIGADDQLQQAAKALECHESQIFEWLPPEKGIQNIVPPAANRKARIAFAKKYWIDPDHYEDGKRYAKEIGECWPEGDAPKAVECFEISEYCRLPSAWERKELEKAGFRFVPRDFAPREK